MKLTLQSICAFYLVVSVIGQAEDSATKTEAATETTEPQPDTFNAKEHTNWGTYYDPNNVFCGEFDCYKILGFDYEEYDKNPPDSKRITKRYRSLSRHWHPDKNKQKGAKEKFVVGTPFLFVSLSTIEFNTLLD